MRNMILVSPHILRLVYGVPDDTHDGEQQAQAANDTHSAVELVLVVCPVNPLSQSLRLIGRVFGRRPALRTRTDRYTDSQIQWISLYEGLSGIFGGIEP